MAAARQVALVVVIACQVFAQTAPRAEFEAAAIKPFVPNERDRSAGGVHVDGSQVRAAGLSLRDLAGIAYNIKATLVFGPDWTASERFEISAALPPGTGQAQLREMFQSLLAGRFQMKVHQEKKELPVYALVQGKGPLKLKESTEDADTAPDAGKTNVTAGGSADGIGVNLGSGAGYTVARNRFEATRLSMPVFAANLERFADRYIIDMTGLTGKYDFAIDIPPDDFRAMLIRSALWAGVNLPSEATHLLDASSPAALGDALQQVGLKLDPRKAPLDVVVIDSALKTPTDN